MSIVQQPLRHGQVEQLWLTHRRVGASPATTPPSSALPRWINHNCAEPAGHGGEFQDALLVRFLSKRADNCLYRRPGNSWVDCAVCEQSLINVLIEPRNPVERGYTGRQKRIRTRICKSSVASNRHPHLGGTRLQPRFLEHGQPLPVREFGLRLYQDVSGFQDSPEGFPHGRSDAASPKVCLRR